MFDVSVEPKSWAVDFIEVHCPFCGEHTYSHEVEKPTIPTTRTEMLVCPNCGALLFLQVDFQPFLLMAEETEDANDTPITIHSEAGGADYIPMYDEKGQVNQAIVCKSHNRTMINATVDRFIFSGQCADCRVENATQIAPVRVVTHCTLYAFTHGGKNDQ